MNNVKYILMFGLVHITGSLQAQTFEQNLEFGNESFYSFDSFNVYITSVGFDEEYKQDWQERFGDDKLHDIDYESLKAYKREKEVLIQRYDDAINDFIRINAFEKNQDDSWYIIDALQSALVSPEIDDRGFKYIESSFPFHVDKLLNDSAYTPGYVNIDDIQRVLEIYKSQEVSKATEMANRHLTVLVTSKELINDDILKVEALIADKLDPLERELRGDRRIILFFSALIALMIIAFFTTIYRKSKDPVVLSLISTDGLQFVTIFILIIAIVLFGALEILEGRELAAIISGISGYILGRRTTGKDKTDELTIIPAQKGEQNLSTGSDPMQENTTTDTTVNDEEITENDDEESGDEEKNKDGK